MLCRSRSKWHVPISPSLSVGLVAQSQPRRSPTMSPSFGDLVVDHRAPIPQNEKYSRIKPNPAPLRSVAAFRTINNQLRGKIEILWISERQRRIELKEFFEILRNCVPETADNERASKVSILQKAEKYIKSLKQESELLMPEIEMLRKKQVMLKNNLRNARGMFSFRDNKK